MKKLLIGLGAIIVLLIVAAVAAPFLIPTDTYKTRLIGLVKDATGRDLKIAGPVKFSILPSLEIAASDVSFANAAGAHDPDMMRLKSLEVQLRVLPLIHGAVELGRFVLTEPQISLEIDKNGHANWDFSAAQATPPARPAGGPAAQTKAATSSSAGALSELHLDDIRLEHGKVSYRDDRTDKAQEIDDINLKLSLPSLDSPLSADGSAVWNGEKVALTVGAANPGALMAGRESAFQIKVASAPVTLGFTGNATGLPPTKLDGAVDLSVPSIRGLAKWAGAPMAPGPGLEKLAIKGQVDVAGTKYAFTNASIAIDAIAANGSLAVDMGGARPALKGTLAVDKLDVNPYLPPEKPASASAAPSGGGNGGAASPAAQAGWSDDPIDVSGLHMADADFDLKVGGILYRKIVVGPSALDLHLKDAKLAVNLSQLQLYQGQGQGKVSVDGAAAVPAVAMNFSLAGLQIEPLAVAAADMDRITGTAKLNFDVAGSGKSQRALISALNGKGAFDLANGQLKGVNLIALAENAGKSLTGGTGGDNTTNFGSLTGTFTITNGILKNTDMQLKSGLTPVTGAGTVNLPTRMVDYRLAVSVAGALNVPILVSGPWDNLSYRPDLAGMLQGVGQGAVNAPGALLNQLQSVGKGVTGGGAGSGSSGGGGVPNPAGMLKNLFGK